MDRSRSAARSFLELMSRSLLSVLGLSLALAAAEMVLPILKPHLLFGAGEELEKANNFFDNPKDAPVLVSAKLTPNIQFILSLDNGFFKPEIKKYVKPIEILKPGAFVERFRSVLG